MEVKIEPKFAPNFRYLAWDCAANPHIGPAGGARKSGGWLRRKGTGTSRLRTLWSV